MDSFSDTVILHRLPSGKSGTFGKLAPLSSNAKFWTLEPSVPVIPDGRYQVVLTRSPKFKCNLPLVIGVKGHDGIRIHCGNTVADTIGCILIGSSREWNTLKGSRSALKRFMSLVKFPFTLVVSSSSRNER